MPELPEVEVLRRDLEREVVGRRVKAVDATGMGVLGHYRNRKQFTSLVEGKKVTAVERRGTYLLLLLDGEAALVVDLGPSGRVLRAKSTRTAMPKGAQVVLTFTQGGQLRFVDPEATSDLRVVALDELETEVEGLANLGIDPLETPMSWGSFGRLVAARRVRLKQLLMDQQFIAGIGDVYSDEILFEAGLRGDRSSDSLTDQEIRRLYRAIVETLQDAVKHRGSTLPDDDYVDLFGEPGDYQHHHKVYEQEGEACRRCRHPIVRRRYSNRSTYFCEACQV